MVQDFGLGRRLRGKGSGLTNGAIEVLKILKVITFRWGAPAAARLDKVCWLRMDVNVSPSVEVAGGFTSDWR